MHIVRHRSGLRQSVFGLTTMLLGACASEPTSAVREARDTDAATPAEAGAPMEAGSPMEAAVADAPTGPGFTASCVYMNPFSRTEECKDYVDPAWTRPLAETDCTNNRGMLREGSACAYPMALGRCDIALPNVRATRITFPGADASQCQTTQRGCSVFARGTFTPLGVCAGDGGVTATDAGPRGDVEMTSPVFLPPVRECRAPRAGEPRGMGPDGQVCTWVAISGSTEEGRRFDDYASCTHVRSQRPYYPSPPAPSRGADPRLADPTYTAELGWVRRQVEASGCVCCHSRRAAPEGPSDWFIEAEGNWIDTFRDTGLALAAGWVDSRALGAYAPGENNGFDRVNAGIPSTDPARLRRFFEAELMRRGRTRESFRSTEPFGGPIYQQLVYTPAACTGTDGIAADGTLRWTGGPARYLYVLDRGSENPGVPPNLDLPRGTRWRVDVAPTSAPVPSGVAYGRTPMGATQRFPMTGTAAPLSPGETYYLYVLADVGIPITRCLFTAPR